MHHHLIPAELAVYEVKEKEEGEEKADEGPRMRWFCLEDILVHSPQQRNNYSKAKPKPKLLMTTLSLSLSLYFFFFGFCFVSDSSDHPERFLMQIQSCQNPSSWRNWDWKIKLKHWNKKAAGVYNNSLFFLPFAHLLNWALSGALGLTSDSCTWIFVCVIFLMIP